MKRITATEAARNFSDLLDGIEATGEAVVVVRRGKIVATIGPAPRANGAEVLRVLEAAPADASWAADLRELRVAVGPARSSDPWPT